jgi:hypothetical protein
MRGGTSWPAPILQRLRPNRFEAEHAVGKPEQPAMGLLDFFRKKPSDDFGMRAELVQLVLDRLRDRQNRIRCEDAICGAAAIVGERCIDAAGDFPLRYHDLAPGSRVFSDRANELLCGDRADGETSPDSVYGILRISLSDAYLPQHYPTLQSVFSGYAAGIGRVEDWGKVPLTVGAHQHPGIVPLQFAIETRDAVDAILRPAAADKPRCLALATKALAAVMNQMTSAIQPEVALRLAFEIANGMAKTAPMTKKAMAAVRKK